jgi:hypothetical protein
MLYEVQMQFIPGLDQIWVARLTPEDPIYQYDNLEETQAKADELQAADPTGRLYRASQLEAVVATEETPVEAPIEETPVEAPIEETPVEETPIEETPVEETPIEETPE